MKSSKLSEAARVERRQTILRKRAATISAHLKRGRSTVQYRTTKFDKKLSDRQRARYARQTGYVAPPPPAPAKRVRKPKSA